MSLSPFALWAKLGAAAPAGYYPLSCHLLDTAAVASALWRRSLPAPTRRLISQMLRVDDEAAAGRWLAFLAALHDLGKATPGFQAQSPAQRHRLQRLGLSFPAAATSDHTLLGTHLLSRLLLPVLGPQADLYAADALATATAEHHGSPRSVRRCGERDLGGQAWDALRVSLLQTVAAHTHPQDQTPPPGLTSPSHALLVLLGALIRLSDWIASNPTNFRCLEEPFTLHEYLPIAADRADKAVAGMNWTDDNTDVNDFAELFGLQPNAMQRIVNIAAGELREPALIILEAPTGVGKTEAALHLAHRFQQNGQTQGYYLALPTQGTATALQQRLQRYEHQEVQLIHGQADPKSAGGLTVSAGRLLAPTAVGTIDQSLLAVAHDRQAWVRLLGLANKTIILNEVHAYDAYTCTLLQRLLEWLAALNCSVIILTATLPQQQREALVQAWTRRAQPLPLSTYPRVTVSTANRLQVYSLPVEQRRRITIRHRPAENDRLAEDLTQALREGGCAACVCNTVSGAQELYQRLREPLREAGIPLSLLHARFPARERRAREQEVLAAFGPGGDRRPYQAVLVATQVVEQSLDVDFDLLISEHAPVDVLLQRLGRLHRHRRPRPATMAEPQMWLLHPPATSGNPFGSAAKVYDEYVLLQSWLQLRDRDSLDLPGETERLIEAVYGQTVPTEQGERLANARQEFLLATERQNWHGMQTALPAPDSPQSFPQACCDHRRVPVRWQDLRQTRIVCLGETRRTGIADADVLNLAEPPAHVLDELLEHAVSLTGEGVCQVAEGLPRPEWWRENPRLRDVSPVCVDAEGCSGTLGLRLDPDLGLLVEDSGAGPA